MKILGIDPGIDCIGWAILDGIDIYKLGTLFPTIPGVAGYMNMSKVVAIEKAIEEKLPELLKDVELVVIEAQFLYPKDVAVLHGGAIVNLGNTLIKMGHVCGYTTKCIDKVTTINVHPSIWMPSKESKKERVLRMESLFGPIKDWPWEKKLNAADRQHAVDALGLAIWGKESGNCS